MKHYLPIPILAAVVVLVQLATALTGTAFYLTQLTMSAYYCLLILGLCMLMGYAGQISLGHAGFFGIGGYLAAALTTRDLTPYRENPLVKLLDSGHLLTITASDGISPATLTVHPWAACLIAIAVALLIALVIGVPVLKLKGHYLAMATLGFGIIIYRIALASQFFGEADGISGVKGLPLFAGLEVSGSFGARVKNYYIAWGLVITGLFLLVNLVHSRIGRALRAIHGSEEAAEAMGVDTARLKLFLFVISAVFAAIAGIFLTHYNGGIGPSEAGVMKSVRYVAIVAIGGMASIWGALIMGAALNFMSLRGWFGTYDDAVFGLILILIMLFAPHGLLRLKGVQTAKNFVRGWRQKP